MRTAWIAACAVVALGSAAWAQQTPVVFDLETVEPSGPGVWKQTVNGITLRFSRASAYGPGLPALDVLHPLQAPMSWGGKSLSPFAEAKSAEPIRIEILNVPAGMGVESISWQMGDELPSDIDGVVFTTDTALGVSCTSTSLVAAPPEASVFYAVGQTVQRKVPITELRVRGGSDPYVNSLYYDNFVLTLAPTQMGFNTYWLTYPSLPMYTEVFASGADIPTNDFGGGGLPGGVSAEGGPGGAPGNPETIDAITTIVRNSNLDKNAAKSFLAKLDQAQRKQDTGDVNGAVGSLRGFINEVEAQRGKKLTDMKADQLIQLAIVVMGAIQT